MGEFRTDITLWNTFNDPDTHEIRSLTWDELVTLFNTRTYTERKDSVATFGPYHVQAPLQPCFRHNTGGMGGGLPRTAPHRCNVCVRHITALVYDVDSGPLTHIIESADLLTQENISHIWYTTHSHCEEVPSFRLVVPVSHPIAVAYYRDLRRSFATRFALSVDLAKCGGPSHQYFLPSSPMERNGPGRRYPSAPPVFDAFAGDVYDTARYADAPVSHRSFEQVGWEPPSPPNGPLDLRSARDTLERRWKTLSRHRDPTKSIYLRRLLDGVALAEHGHRDHVTTIVCGIVAYALPGESLELLMALIAPSLSAMMTAGSKLTPEKVEGKFLSAMRAKAQADHDTEAATVRAQLKLRNNVSKRTRQQLETFAVKFGIPLGATV